MVVVLASTENMPYDEWLDWRKKGIGGSDASVVCGINRYKSPVELWLEKMNQLPYQEAGEAAYWGTQLEALVRTEFTKRTGIAVHPANQLLQSEAHPFMLANLDGTCQHPNYGTCVFEAKTASAYKAGEWDDAIPDEYILQVQHYLAVTGYKGAYIAVLIGGNTFRWKFIERDEELISLLLQLEGDFWEHVQAMVPPPLDGSDASAKFLSERFPNSVPKSKIALPDTAVELIRQYEAACENVNQYTEQKQAAENLLKQMLGDSEIGIAEDRVITWKSVSQERLDGKTLKAEHPVLYKKYANQTSYRHFSIKAAV
ncbi:YqaJ viral recombinase family protein|uniref:Putative phage-type endonuclease n=1 Tax=Dendrosporobacter quercicolus TaxID=146817 RepID=A0A1G9LYK0_9FIRM|nr:YqaJ viral recombinase family protein [Dendrosporobacter quercicolus]NSL46860.1 YqaJ viral recombinase family protein [Dendrosporobacter quercicolus DSM 1736]SDL67058.1 putative phage-type endonuclease [Dendrosporobacter quercicolus]